MATMTTTEAQQIERAAFDRWRRATRARDRLGNHLGRAVRTDTLDPDWDRPVGWSTTMVIGDYTIQGTAAWVAAQVKVHHAARAWAESVIGSALVAAGRSVDDSDL